jgi:hypothetical protein
VADADRCGLLAERITAMSISAPYARTGTISGGPPWRRRAAGAIVVVVMRFS